MKLVDNIAAFTNVIGLDHLGLIWELSQVPWESEYDRNMFIAEVANLNLGPINNG